MRRLIWDSCSDARWMSNSRRVRESARQSPRPVGDAAYYLVWLLFLPAILGALGLESLLVPVQGMIDQFLSLLPLLAAAAILLIVGWFVARIIQRIVTGFLASVGVDRFAERVGIAKYMGSMTVSYLLGLIVFIVVLIPIVTAALDALNLRIAHGAADRDDHRGRQQHSDLFCGGGNSRRDLCRWGAGSSASR